MEGSRLEFHIKQVDDNITVFVEDELTPHDRCRFVYSNHTYFVQLSMLIDPMGREIESETAEVEGFVPESEGIQLPVFGGSMGLDPDEHSEIFEKAHWYKLPHSDLPDLIEYDTTGDYTVLMMGGEFLYTKTSDWEAYQQG